MMGNRGHTNGLDDDALGKLKRYLRWGRGERKALKRAYRQRLRAIARLMIRRELRLGDW